MYHASRMVSNEGDAKKYATTCKSQSRGGNNGASSQGQRQVKAISFGQMILLPCGEIYALFFRGDKMTDFKDHGIFSKIRNPTLDTFVQLNYPLDFQVDDVKFEMKRYFNKYLWAGGAVTSVTNLDRYLESKVHVLSPKL